VRRRVYCVAWAPTICRCERPRRAHERRRKQGRTARAAGLGAAGGTAWPGFTRHADVCGAATQRLRRAAPRLPVTLPAAAVEACTISLAAA